MKTIAIVNQKGGVGKTTTTINLAAGLSKAGHRVLVVDLDPQRNASTSLNRGEYQGVGINDLIYFTVSGNPFDVAAYVRHNDLEDIDYIPAAPVLASAPGILGMDRDSSTVLSRILRLPFFAKYDYCLLDCKPSLDLLVVNALVASDQVIVPIEPEEYAVEGLTDILGTVDRVCGSFNEGLHINGILINRAVLSRKRTGEIIEQLRSAFGPLVYRTVIPNLAEAAKAQDARCSMVNCAAAKRTARLYLQFVEEVLEHD